MTNDPSPTAPRPKNASKFSLSTFSDVRDDGAHSRDVSDTSTFVDTAPSSRASTPDSTVTLTANFRGAEAYGNWDEKAGSGKPDGRNEEEEEMLVVVGAAGRLPEEVYERTLSWWRAGIRRAIVRNVERESRVLATMQVSGLCDRCGSGWRFEGVVILQAALWVKERFSPPIPYPERFTEGHG